jgi:hypothetical protein
MTYDQIVRRLEQVWIRLESMDHQAEEKYVRAKRDFEYAKACEFLKTEGTVAEREAETTRRMFSHVAYKAFVVAEAGWLSARAEDRALEKSISIGQSLLKACSREAPQQGQQPAWTRRAA